MATVAVLGGIAMLGMMGVLLKVLLWVVLLPIRLVGVLLFLPFLLLKFVVSVVGGVLALVLVSVVGVIAVLVIAGLFVAFA